MRSVRLIVTGRVQGVGYRIWAERTASALGLRGWVRNRRDGSVEALFCGPAQAVKAMVEACRRGPPAARVDHVAEQPAAPPAGPGFHQRHTE